MGFQKVMVLAVAAAAGKKRDIMVRAVPPRGEGVIWRERDQVAHHSQGLGVVPLEPKPVGFFWTLGSSWS